MNFVFFFPDEMRADSVSCYGHPLVKMPNYDRVAREGVKFEQCHVQHPVCSPSRCSLMTGWYPHVNGHRTLWHLLRSHEPSLFRYLKNSGYQIRWFGKNDLHDAESLPQVADEYDARPGLYYGADLYEFEEPGHLSFLKGPVEGTVEDTSDMKNVQCALDFLYSYQEGDQPFMLYLPLTMPHAPYSAPEPFYSMYEKEDIPPFRPICEDKPEYHSLIRKYRNIEAFPEEDMKKLNAVYLGMNSFVDYMLGRVLDALDEKGLTNDTVVIICSDHGDWAGDYGLVEKWPNDLSDPITRVPLIIRMPGNKEGHVIKEQVEMFDIMPTVLELAGIRCEHTHFAQSLVPQLRGANGDPERYVFAEGGYDTHEPNCFEGFEKRMPANPDPKSIYRPKLLQQQEHPESVCRATMIRSLDYKLVKRPKGMSELYDLTKDPKELQNLYYQEKYRLVRDKLEAKMLDWYIHTSDVVPYKEDNRGF